MTCPPPARQFVVSLLALMKDLSLKEIGSPIGMEAKRISYHLTKESELSEDLFEQFLQAILATPGEIASAVACYEALIPRPELTPEERDVVELEVLEVSRWYRGLLVRAVPLSRAVPPLHEYPRPSDAEPARWLAGVKLAYLRQLPRADRLPVVGAAGELQTWGLCEAVAEEAVQAASRDLGEAFHWARLARQIAKRVRGPEGWRKRLQAYAVAVFANTLRVAGRLKAADRIMKEARRLWFAGSDPDQVLDPGRLLDLEGSLRRDQRRFPEAIATLDAALLVSRTSARILINKGFTLEVMGDYESAVEALLQAKSRLESQRDSRLENILHLNLAVNLCNAGRHREATQLVEQVRAVATNMGDEIGVLRCLWLQGRIEGGLGRPEEALRLLAQAQREFAIRTMWFDVALALLEQATLLLNEGWTAEVKALAPGLAEVFRAQGVHREALAALQLFQEAIERETATAELARGILRYLFRARHDPGLPFTS